MLGIQAYLSQAVPYLSQALSPRARLKNQFVSS